MAFRISDLLGDHPAPVQNEIRKAEAFELGLITGFAAGKTRGICAAALEHMARYPGAKVLLGRKTYQETINTVKQPFFDMATVLRDGGWFVKPSRWDYREGTNHCQLSNGSQAIFSNLDDPIKFRNEEYSMVVVDQAEEIKEELWDILCARVRWPKVPADARRVIAAANDNGHNWMWRRFVDKPRLHAMNPWRCKTNPLCTFLDVKAPETDHVVNGLVLPCYTRAFFHGTTLENKHNLAPKYLSILLSYPQKWQERFIYATMESGEGRLLPDPKVVRFFDPPAHWPRWRALDHALNSPACCLWLTVNTDDVEVGGVSPDAVYVYREYYQEDRSVDQHARAILSLSGTERFIQDVMDRSAFQLTQSRQGGVRLSIADLYREESGDKLVWSGSVGDPFARVERIITAHNRGMVVADTCRNLIKQMPEYYAEASKITGLYKIVNKSDFHAVDALGYGVMMIPINARAELVATPGEERPEYLRRRMEADERRHHEAEYRRFKRHEERQNIELYPPALRPMVMTEFWGDSTQEIETVAPYDMFGGRH